MYSRELSHSQPSFFQESISVAKKAGSVLVSPLVFVVTTVAHAIIHSLAAVYLTFKAPISFIKKTVFTRWDNPETHMTSCKRKLKKDLKEAIMQVAHALISPYLGICNTVNFVSIKGFDGEELMNCPLH